MRRLLGISADEGQPHASGKHTKKLGLISADEGQPHASGKHTKKLGLLVYYSR